MEDDDDYSDSLTPDDNNYLSELYQRLTAETNSMDDEPSDDNSSVSSFMVYDYDYDPESEIDFYDEDDMSDEDDDSSSDALSEASTVVNGENQQQSQSGTDTEVEEREEEHQQQDEEGQDERVEGHNESSEEIVHSQKKIKLDESAEKPVEPIEDDSIDEDQRCPICLECWSNAGEHRLCSLRCGHLFGLKCITQWFSVAQNATARKCPECNAKASKKDVRILYAKSLRCLDTSEIEKLKVQLKDLSTKKDRAERELSQFKDKEIIYEQQIKSLRLKVSDLERKIRNMSSETSSYTLQTDTNILKKHKIYDICSNNSCRVMAYNPWHRILVATSGNSISKVYVDTLSASLNIKVHGGPVRDVAFQDRHPDILLSVGFDKKIILTDIRKNFPTHSYSEETNLWSCCWSNYNAQTFFVGGARGNVIEYDIRNLQSGVSTKENVKDRSPVISLASVPTSSPALRAGGYLACQLNSCSAYGYKEGNYVGNQIDFEGPFTSLRYNEKDNHVLLSCRANAKNPSVRHIVCSVEKNEDKFKFNAIHTFNAGSSQKLLSRPCYMNLKNDTVVIAHNESLNSILAWSISSGQEVYSLPISESVVDVCSFENRDVFQAVLTSNKLQLYSYQDKSL